MGGVVLVAIPGFIMLAYGLGEVPRAAPRAALDPGWLRLPSLQVPHGPALELALRPKPWVSAGTPGLPGMSGGLSLELTLPSRR